MPSSVLFDSATDYYFNTTTPPSGNLTFACWAKITLDRNAQSTIFAIDGGDLACVLLLTDSTGTNTFIYHNGGFNPLSGLTGVVGTWYKLAYVRNGTVGTFYFAAAGSLLGNIVGTAAAFTPTEVSIGACRRTAAAQFFNGSVAAVKVWTAALTAAELEAEFTQYNPMRRTNLQRYYSFANGPQTNDESGNGFTLTAGAGALTTDTAGPPIPLAIIRKPMVVPATVSVADSFNW